MSSKVDKAKALAMRESGATLQQIGDAFGVTRERVRQVILTEGLSHDCRSCNAPLPADMHSARRYCDECAASRRKEAIERSRFGVCPRCEGRKVLSAKLCRDCSVEGFRSSAENQLVVELWGRGESISTIAAALDTTVSSLGARIHRMRKHGFDLPYRRRVFLNGTPAYPDLEIREMRPKPVPVLDLNTKEIVARRRNLERTRARRRFHGAVSRGKLTRPDACERCGATARVEGHHADYDRPLEVEWLCFDCHRAHHIADGTYGKRAA